MCFDFASGVTIAAIIMIATPTQPIMFGMLASENIPGLLIPSIEYWLHLFLLLLMQTFIPLCNCLQIL